MSFKRKNKTLINILWGLAAIAGLAMYLIFKDLVGEVYEEETTKRYELNAKF